jgi:uncharacterized protein (DUF305 family)
MSWSVVKSARATAFLSIMFCLHAHAQMTGMAGRASMSASSSDPAAQPATAGTDAFMRAEKSMMSKMSQPYTGNIDQDFVSHMEPHHEGAIAMAEVELKYGKDPALKRLARNIIKAQQREIAFMKQWRNQHPAQ